jgi:hypothetical protein
MKVGKIEIHGSGTLQHLSIRYYKTPSKAMTEDGLALLLSSFGAKLTRDDLLQPCFDLDEMIRRNQAHK